MSCQKGILWDRHEREGELCHAGKGFCEVGMTGEGEMCHAGKGICGSRHDREGELCHAGKGICGVGMTGEPLAPAQKEKASL